MARDKEIVIILKSLLAETESAIDKRQYSTKKDEIINASRKVVALSLITNSYLEELDVIKSQ
jgi:hypothetical protein